MKSIGFSIIGLLILGSQAFATEVNTIVKCQAFDPAFTTVMFNESIDSSGLPQLGIIVSRYINVDEGIKIEDIYDIDFIEKDRVPLKEAAYSSALLKVVEDIENDKFGGSIFVKAHPFRSQNDQPLFINFQRFEGNLPNSMVIGGLALRLNCTIGC